MRDVPRAAQCHGHERCCSGPDYGRAEASAVAFQLAVQLKAGLSLRFTNKTHEVLPFFFLMNPGGMREEESLKLQRELAVSSLSALPPPATPCPPSSFAGAAAGGDVACTFPPHRLMLVCHARSSRVIFMRLSTKRCQGTFTVTGCAAGQQEEVQQRHTRRRILHVKASSRAILMLTK
jgi:hypothetical protein